MFAQIPSGKREIEFWSGAPPIVTIDFDSFSGVILNIQITYDKTAVDCTAVLNKV